MNSINVLQAIGNTQQINPIRRGNEAKTVTKNEDGSLSVEFANGQNGTVEDKTMQAFVIWTMIHESAKA